MSVATGSISIASFATFIGAPVGIVSTSFSLAYSISTGLIKKLLKTTRRKKKKLNFYGVNKKAIKNNKKEEEKA